MRVLVVDPDAEQRAYMVNVLSGAGFGAESVASSAEALAAARRERPQVAILEIWLEDGSGYELCRALREEFGNALGIMFVSGDRTRAGDRAAGLMIGADEYMGKPLDSSELIARLGALTRRAGADDYLRAPALRTGLTDRELEVLHLLADGHHQHEIAERLVVSPRTVGKHIEHILSKLPARSRAEAVAIAYQRGLHAPPKATSG